MTGYAITIRLWPSKSKFPMRMRFSSVIAVDHTAFPFQEYISSSNSFGVRKIFSPLTLYLVNWSSLLKCHQFATFLLADPKDLQCLAFQPSLKIAFIRKQHFSRAKGLGQIIICSDFKPKQSDHRIIF